jgi:integrase
MKQVTSQNSSKDRDGLHRRPKGPQGIWYFYYRGLDGNWHEKSSGTRSYSEARQIRTTELEKRQRGEVPSQLADWNLRDASDLWLEQRKYLVLPVTFKGYRWILAPLLETLGAKRLKDLNLQIVQGYQGKRAGQVSSRCVNREIQTLLAILRLAKLGSDLIDLKPLRRRTNPIGRALTPEEEHRLFTTAASRPAWETVFSLATLAANTGLRSGEIKRLRICDICAASQTIIVRRQATKTDAGARLIPLNPIALLAANFLLNRARSLGATLPDQFLLPANPSKHTKELIHSVSGFDPQKHQVSFRTAWRTLTRAAGLKGLRFHDLRHNFVTRLAEAHVPIQVTMSLVGHMSFEMTRHYTHISDNARREAVNSLHPTMPTLSLLSPSDSGGACLFPGKLLVQNEERKT